MIFPIDRFQQLQQALAGYLLSSPYFAGLQVFVSFASIQPDGTQVLSPDIQSAIDKAIQGVSVSPNNGQIGVAAIVSLPVLSVYDHRSNVNNEEIDIAISFIENVTKNYSAQGTGISAMSYADHALSEFTSWSPGAQFGGYAGVCGMRGREGRTVVPVLADGQDMTYRTYNLNLFCYATGYKVTRCAMPIASVSNGTVTMSCATAGAAIWYTTNGTMPYPGNSTASLYSAPIMSSGDFFRIAGYASGVTPSNVFELTTPAESYYLRPDGTSIYLRPDGVSTYFRPN